MSITKWLLHFGIMLEAGIACPVVASMMGWSAATAIRIAKRYEHIGSKALREAADVLGRPNFPEESLKKSPKSEKEENVDFAVSRRKRNGSSCRTRINGLTYFQRDAGQRMTPKTIESSDQQSNRARIERKLWNTALYVMKQLTT